MGSKQKLSVLSSVDLGVLHADLGESLADGAGRFVGSKNSLASSRDGSSILNQLSSKRRHGYSRTKLANSGQTREHKIIVTRREKPKGVAVCGFFLAQKKLLSGYS
jgi:hypothetical protein